MTDKDSNIPKQRKKSCDESEIEDQVQDILKSTDVPDIGKIDLDEQIRARLSEADASELDSLEEELGIPSDSEFYEIINKDDEGIFEPVAQVIENQKKARTADEINAGVLNEGFSEVKDEKISMDGNCTVTVTGDKMSAVIDLKPSEGNGKPLTYEAVNMELKAKGVVYGVNTELLKKLIRNVENTKDVKRGVIIAQGTLPEQGRDGSIEFHFSDDESILFENDKSNGDKMVT